MTLLDHTSKALERFDPGARPLLYAGRFADAVAVLGIGEPPGVEVLSEWDVLPVRLAKVLAGATALIVLDPLSFPYEPTAWDLRNIPLVVFLPSGQNVSFLDAVFGKPLFEQLGFFDRLVVHDGNVWKVLSEKYNWAGRQRVCGLPEGVGEMANGTLQRLLENLLARPEEETARTSRAGKSAHRTQRAALFAQFEAARGERAPDVPFEVLQVGAEDGRWTASFDPETTRFCGACAGREAAGTAKTDFPRACFEPLGEGWEGSSLPWEDESFDLVFSVDALRRLDAPSKREVLSEMWRVARPGGRLLFLEDFVFERGREEGVYPMSVRRFTGLAWEATAGQVVLEHVQSIRYPDDDFVRAGVVSVSKLGVPRRW